MMRLRRYWLVAHRWIGLGFGCVLLLAAITGSLLVLARPLDEAMHPRLFRAQGTAPAVLQPIVSRLRAEFGADAAFNIRLPAHPGESLRVSVSGPWNGTLFLDPASGLEAGRRAAGEGFFNVLFELHSSLYAGDTGRAVLALAALAYVAMLLSGLVLWWPRRWRRAFAVRTRSGPTVALLDLHRVAGAALGLLVLVSVVTGAYLAWRPIAGWVTAASGQSPRPVTAPRVEASGVASVSIDTALLRAQVHWPDAHVSAVHVPPRSLAAARARLRLPDDPHPIGMSTVWLDPASGRVRAAGRWSELDPGNRAFSFLYPLHTGDLAGAATSFAILLAGIALAGVGCTGLWMWYRRRTATLPARHAQSVTAGKG